MNKQQHQAEKEMRKIVGALLLSEPTTTSEGMREYKRLERRVHKIAGNDRKISRWEKIRQNLILSFEELDKELNMEIIFWPKKKKKGKVP